MIPLSLYIHIPWCVRKCPYCDFNSHVSPQKIDEAGYIARLIEDLKADIALYKIDRPLKSIFIGGGTPSLFSSASIAQLLVAVGDQINIEEGAEITLEANPGSLEVERFSGFVDAGVNRLSLGIQSFNDDQLKRLGRVHDSEQAMRAIEAVKSVGFKSFNIDVMYGLPEQTVEQAMADIHQAIEFNPPHISAYQLTLEPNTVFAQRPPKLPNEDVQYDIESSIRDALFTNGYQQYEVSAYSLSTQEQAQHNLNYWTFGDYLGIGAGAHGKITQGNVINRTEKIYSPKAYMLRQMLKSTRQVSEQEIGIEFMMNALRLNNGFLIADFEKNTLQPMNAMDIYLDKAQALGLLTCDATRVSTTDKGKRYLNDALEVFL